jgi:cytochrome P450
MTTRPDIPSDIVLDVDHLTAEFNRDELAISNGIRQRCPVAWNPRYGGFWFATGYEAVAQIAKDGETFAHKYEPNAGDGIDYYGELGIPRPEGQPALGIGEIDGPFHLALRRALNPIFTPQAVERMRPFTEQSVHWFLDQKIADGHMDLVLDFASPVPAILTMRMMGLPYDDWQMYADLFHSTMAFNQESDEYRRVVAQVPEMMADVIAFANTRRGDPHDDLTSFLVQFEFQGERLSDEQLIGILWNLIGGGVDTTTSLTSWSFFHLGTHPGVRQQLIEHPELYRSAADEYLRYYSVNQTLSRTVTRDVELRGQQLRRNDRVLISWLAANHDEHEFERPDEVLLDRAPNRQIGFGLGPHRCIGSHLARHMFEVMVRGVLERLPDYELAVAEPDQYLGSPSMTGLAKLPVTFTPGTSLGTQRPY